MDYLRYGDDMKQDILYSVCYIMGLMVAFIIDRIPLHNYSLWLTIATVGTVGGLIPVVMAFCKSENGE